MKNRKTLVENIWVTYIYLWQNPHCGCRCVMPIAIQTHNIHHISIIYLIVKRLGQFFKMLFHSLMMFTTKVILLYETGPIQLIYHQHCEYWWPGALAPRLTTHSCILRCLRVKRFTRVWDKEIINFFQTCTTKTAKKLCPGNSVFLNWFILMQIFQYRNSQYKYEISMVYCKKDVTPVH